MVLSWNEIRKRAIEFSREWEGESREKAEAQSFWNEFFNIFGITRRRVASFEEPVQKLGDKRGNMDLFWKGMLLVEHKSKGQDLSSAYSQAMDYFSNLEEYELPRYIIVSDFSNFRLRDLDFNKEYDFPLKELYKNIHHFDFIAGYIKKEIKDEDPVNIKAAELLGEFYDEMKESGYPNHKLEHFLVRILFCLFADDAGIFEKGIFTDYIEQRTNRDGSDLGQHLATIFQILNTPVEKRLKTLDDNLSQFQYINGNLFEENLPIASFDSDMRKVLLKCCYFDWSIISPAIFGSLFQSVMDPEKRRNLGAHYTTEKNILKLVKPLFLDELRDEFNKIKKNKLKLEQFHSKISKLKFFDPACGCGNFLVITYRELRMLEIDVLQEIHKSKQGLQHVLDIGTYSKIDVDAFYGIEIEEFPAQIAEVAMWLMDHIMNTKLSEAFGQYYIRLPLKKAAKIVNDNALEIDWATIVPPNEINYILGNPPYTGKQLQSDEQRKEMDIIFLGVNGSGVLDYVSAWFLKAAQYIQGTNIKVAFVATNSITQGEQVGILWAELFNKYGIKIHFAHRTFSWSSEARGKAHVYVIIVGFANYDIPKKLLYDYDTVKSEPHEIKVKNINPYLVEGRDLVVTKRNTPLCNVPEMMYGSKPVDGGNLILNDMEKNELVNMEPKSIKYIKPLISAKEYLEGERRWCLWLVDIKPDELKAMPEVYRRVMAVRTFRLSSKKEPTRSAANTPMLFAEIRQPNTSFVLMPLTTSENRKYIPMEFFSKEYIINNSSSIIPNASMYHFGVIASKMHMTWVQHVCGRLEGRYRYSNEIVYNNFPWPVSPKTEQIANVEKATKIILKVRKTFSKNTLSELYDPITMPKELIQAHQELDKAVDKCYRKAPFKGDKDRIEYLFELYEDYLSKAPSKASKKKINLK